LFEVSFTGAVTLVFSNPVQNQVFIDGKDVTNSLWELAGAFDGCTVRVKNLKKQTASGTFDAIELKVTHPEILKKPMERTILLMIDEDGADYQVIDNVAFYIRDEYQGNGIATNSLLHEAIAAHKLGFSKIFAMAANDPAVGWKVWPKLGYDATIEPDILIKMDTDLMAAGLQKEELRISDLLDAGRGDLWEKHGCGCMMEFDVSDIDSWSMTRLLDRTGGS
jgi:GNAT superfamily N-acetyltransferase